MNRRSSLRLMGWPMPPTSGDVLWITLPLLAPSCLRRIERPARCSDTRCTGTGCRKAPANVFLAGLRIVTEERVGRHQHSGGAEAALQAVLFLEPFLQRVQLAVLDQALDCQDFAAIGLHGEHGAGFDGFAVEEHGAGAAMTGVAPDVAA